MRQQWHVKKVRQTRCCRADPPHAARAPARAPIPLITSPCPILHAAGGRAGSHPWSRPADACTRCGRRGAGHGPCQAASCRPAARWEAVPCSASRRALVQAAKHEHTRSHERRVQRLWLPGQGQPGPAGGAPRCRLTRAPRACVLTGRGGCRRAPAPAWALVRRRPGAARPPRAAPRPVLSAQLTQATMTAASPATTAARRAATAPPVPGTARVRGGGSAGPPARPAAAPDPPRAAQATAARGAPAATPAALALPAATPVRTLPRARLAAACRAGGPTAPACTGYSGSGGNTGGFGSTGADTGYGAGTGGQQGSGGAHLSPAPPTLALRSADHPRRAAYGQGGQGGSDGSRTGQGSGEALSLLLGTPRVRPAARAAGPELTWRLAQATPGLARTTALVRPAARLPRPTCSHAARAHPCDRAGRQGYQQSGNDGTTGQTYGEPSAGAGPCVLCSCLPAGRLAGRPGCRGCLVPAGSGNDASGPGFGAAPCALASRLPPGRSALMGRATATAGLAADPGPRAGATGGSTGSGTGTGSGYGEALPRPQRVHGSPGPDCDLLSRQRRHPRRHWHWHRDRHRLWLWCVVGCS